MQGGRRKWKDIGFALVQVLRKKGIEFIHEAADRIEPKENGFITVTGEVPYDHLIIAT